MQSIWSETTNISNREPLPGDIHVQNLIIGGGMAGILTAYLLKRKGLEGIVVEADTIASGQSKNTTAKITSQHGLCCHKMIKQVGLNRAKGYMAANEEAVKMYRRIIEEEGISCDLQILPSFLYSTEEKGKEQLRNELQAVRALGQEGEYVDGNTITELPFTVSGALRFPHQAQFHPLKFIRALAENLTVYENTNVISVHGHKVTTNRGTIIAENIIFATHYPFINVPGFYFIREHQERSYVLALKGKDVPEKLTGMYYGIDEGGLSFRSGQGMLILGGGAHRTGKKSCDCKKEGYSYLREQARRYYPDGKEKTCWAAQDCMPHDGIPFIGRYSVFRPYWYVATGFQKWGMTSSMVSAMLISDRISSRYNSYEAVFTPQRILFLAGIRNLCLDIGESTVGLVKGLFGKKESRCTHMGCRLNWNKEENSWDCPCHGSRFDRDKNVIDSPAQPLE